MAHADDYGPNGETLNPDKTFEAGYGRTGTIKLMSGTCDVCNRDLVRVLAIDSSEGEYGPCFICLDCVVQLFEE